MFFKKLIFLFCIILLVSILLSFLFLLQNPYGCDKENTECIIEKATFYKDAYVCSRIVEKDYCFFEVAQRIEDPFFCNHAGDEGNYSKEKCLALLNKA